MDRLYFIHLHHDAEEVQVSKSDVLIRWSGLAAVLVFSSFGVEAQVKHQVHGKVVNGSNTGLERIEVWVEDESRRRIGRGLTGRDGLYTVEFAETAKIKIFYGDYYNAVPDLSGRTNHELTKVVVNIATAGTMFSDQGGADAASLEYASSKSCQTYHELRSPNEPPVTEKKVARD